MTGPWLAALREAGDVLAAVATEWGRKSGIACDAEMHARLASALAAWEEARAETSEEPCGCAEGERCSNSACRGAYYDEIERVREATPSDAELRKHVVRRAESSQARPDRV